MRKRKEIQTSRKQFQEKKHPLSLDSFCDCSCYDCCWREDDDDDHFVKKMRQEDEGE